MRSAVLSNLTWSCRQLWCAAGGGACDPGLECDAGNQRRPMGGLNEPFFPACCCFLSLTRYCNEGPLCCERAASVLLEAVPYHSTPAIYLYCRENEKWAHEVSESIYCLVKSVTGRIYACSFSFILLNVFINSTLCRFCVISPRRADWYMCLKLLLVNCSTVESGFTSWLRGQTLTCAGCVTSPHTRTCLLV